MSLRDVQRPTAVQCACGAVQLSLRDVQNKQQFVSNAKIQKSFKFLVSSFQFFLCRTSFSCFFIFFSTFGSENCYVGIPISRTCCSKFSRSPSAPFLMRAR